MTYLCLVVHFFQEILDVLIDVFTRTEHFLVEKTLYHYKISTTTFNFLVWLLQYGATLLNRRTSKQIATERFPRVTSQCCQIGLYLHR